MLLSVYMQIVSPLKIQCTTTLHVHVLDRMNLTKGGELQPNLPPPPCLHPYYSVAGVHSVSINWMKMCMYHLEMGIAATCVYWCYAPLLMGPSGYWNGIPAGSRIDFSEFLSQ